MPDRDSMTKEAFGHVDGCLCCDCGERYKVDLILDDGLWQRILRINAGKARRDIRDPDGGLLVSDGDEDALCDANLAHEQASDSFDAAPAQFVDDRAPDHDHREEP